MASRNDPDPRGHTIASLRSFVRRNDTSEGQSYLRAFDALYRQKESYRIEADCGLRDYDALELDAGVMGEALTAIARKRPNQAFDPWAVATAKAALAQLRVASAFIYNGDSAGAGD